jgi:hypothetical protein
VRLAQASAGGRAEAKDWTNVVQSRDKPLLLVDVDGVISLFGFAVDRRPPGTWLNVEGIPHLISAAAAEHLLALSDHFELTWCTGWEEKANDHLVAALGLPRALPYLTFAAAPATTAHWKLAAIDAHAGDRPLAWVDDAFNDACRAWATARPAPTLLVETSPADGLEAPQVSELIRFARDRARAGR